MIETVIAVQAYPFSLFEQRGEKNGQESDDEKQEAEGA